MQNNQLVGDNIDSVDVQKSQLDLQVESTVQQVVPNKY
jgi:hypothetical protein